MIDWRWSAPPERLAAVRIVIFGWAALYLIIRSVALTDIDAAARSFDGIGGVWWLDAPLSGATLTALLVAAVAAAIAAAAGWRYSITAPCAAVAILVLLSHRLSFGQVLHTENLLVLHTLALAAMPAADAWRIGARPATTERATTYGWSLQALTAITTIAYAVAAWAKIRNGGLDWLSGDVLRNHVAHDNLRKELLGDPSSPIAPHLVPHPWLFAPMAWVSMIVELLAPAMIVASHRWRVRWVALAWLFHAGVLAVMAILFPYQLLLIAFVPMLHAERLGPTAMTMRGRLSRRPPTVLRSSRRMPPAHR